jgi:hypothetical protein
MPLTKAKSNAYNLVYWRVQQELLHRVELATIHIMASWQTRAPIYEQWQSGTTLLAAA